MDAAPTMAITGWTGTGKPQWADSGRVALAASAWLMGT